MDYSFEGIPFFNRCILSGKKTLYPTGELNCDKMTSQISEGKHSFDMDLLKMTKNKRILVKGRMQPLCFPERTVAPRKFC